MAEIMEEQQQNTPQPPKKKKYAWLGKLFLLAVIALGLFMLFGIVGEAQGGSLTLQEAIARIDWWHFAILIGVLLLILLVDTLKFFFATKSICGKASVATSMKVNLLGRYYDAVTPFSTGGQPMQIYYMHTKGISGGSSTAIVLSRYFGTMVSWLTLAALFMILGISALDGQPQRTLLLVAGWIGWAVNLALPLAILLFMLFPKIALKITTFFVSLGKKMKLVKNPDRIIEHAVKVVTDFKNSFKALAQHPIYLILFTICCFIESFITYAFPYLVMKALSCPVEGMFVAIFALNAYAIQGVSFIPTPGNSGVVESIGALAFATAAGPALTWAVLLWRFVAYYFYIIIGIGMNIFDVIRSFIRDRRYKKEKTE